MDMGASAKHDRPAHLVEPSHGDSHASECVATALYEELRAIAGAMFRAERRNHTLQPTALVHEAYLRLMTQQNGLDLERAQFLAIGAKMIRRVLVDHARRHRTKKRGGGLNRITLAEVPEHGVQELVDLLALDDAMQALRELDERESSVVELKYFAGMTDREAAQILGVSERTIRDDWKHAKAWLQLRLSDGVEHDS